MKSLNSIIIFSFLLACAKERPFDVLYKGDELFVKSSTSGVSGQVLPCQDISDPCLYLPSVVESPRNVSATRPYWMGQQKLVTLEIGRENLIFKEVEIDNRFSSNPRNMAPVMSIPVEHKDFRCKENDFKECTNKEEENKDLAWHQKRFVEVNFEKTSIDEVNMLPIQIDNLFFRNSCHRELSARIIERKVEDKAMNLIIEKTFQSDLGCLNSIESLSDITFTVTYHYSLVQLSQLTDPAYQKVHYDIDDENQFGYFKTTSKSLSVDNRKTHDHQVDYLNRFSPNKKEIIYYLTDNFYKDDMKAVLAATNKGVDSINNSFKAAGMNQKIVLKKAAGRHSGDLRNNMIVLVEDPQATGIIGYGPSATNPLTGEIVHARNVMYYGNIKKFIKRAYDDLLELNGIDSLSGEKIAKIRPTVNLVEPKVSGRDLRQALDVMNFGDNHQHHRHDHLRLDVQASDRNITNFNAQLAKREVFSNNRKLNLNQLSQYLSFDEVSSFELEQMNLQEYLSRYNAYHADYVNFDQAARYSFDTGALTKALGGKLKIWGELTSSQKQLVIDTILPHVWIPTFVHEMGHNLGLRHNFNGSEDKENFYTEAELKKMGINQPITYSSVMDYSYSNWNELPVMGKYDIAALRFGYKREVELDNNKLLVLPESTTPIKSVKNKLGEAVKLKSYRYCTDEHVAVNPGCNRFDEGTNLAEIAQHYVDAYHTRYKRSRFRGDSYSFSLTEDAARLGSINYTMRGLRLFFEVYDRLKGMYSMTDADLEKIAQSNEWIRDLIKAVHIAGDFYIDVIKTPDVHCGLVVEGSKQVVQVLSLDLLNRSLGTSALSCFDLPSIPSRQSGVYLAAATELGRHFQSKKDDNNRHKLSAYVDQIDVSGIWMDKLLAMRYLMQRTLGESIFDRYTSNFFDMPVFREKITNLLQELAQDNISVETHLVTRAGEKVKYDGTFSFATSHTIPAALTRGVNQFFNLKPGNNHFSEKLFKQFATDVINPEDLARTAEFYQLFGIYRELPRDGTNLDDLERIETSMGSFFVKSNNIFAQSLRHLMNAKGELEKLGPEQVYQLVTSEKSSVQTQERRFLGLFKRKNRSLEEISPLESIPEVFILAYLQDQMPTDTHLLNVLMSLPKLD